MYSGKGKLYLIPTWRRSNPRALQNERDIMKKRISAKGYIALLYPTDVRVGEKWRARLFSDQIAIIFPKFSIAFSSAREHGFFEHSDKTIIATVEYNEERSAELSDGIVTAKKYTIRELKTVTI